MKPPVGEWAEQAACRPEDPDDFFPARGSDYTVAKRICALCDVRAECLAYAMTSPVERIGVWGGLSPRQRQNFTFTLGDPLPPVNLSRGGPPPKPGPIVHGTVAGWSKHNRTDGIPCDECLRAKQDYDRTRKRQQRRHTADAIAETEAAIGPRRTHGRILEVVR